jgi:DNA repair protein RadC
MLIPIQKKHAKEKMLRALDVFGVLRDILLSKHQFDRQKEHFWVVLLSRNCMITYIDEVSIGNLHSTIVSPREVFRFAILKGCDSVIICHNHPSGNLEPSEADKRITRELTAAGKILGIQIIDSLIITEKNYNSII